MGRIIWAEFVGSGQAAKPVMERWEVRERTCGRGAAAGENDIKKWLASDVT